MKMSTYHYVGTVVCNRKWGNIPNNYIILCSGIFLTLSIRSMHSHVADQSHTHLQVRNSKSTFHYRTSKYTLLLSPLALRLQKKRHRGFCLPAGIVTGTRNVQTLAPTFPPIPVALRKALICTPPVAGVGWLLCSGGM